MLFSRFFDDFYTKLQFYHTQRYEKATLTIVFAPKSLLPSHWNTKKGTLSKRPFIIRNELLVSAHKL